LTTLDEDQRKLVHDYPAVIQEVFLGLHFERVEELARTAGYRLSTEDIERLRRVTRRPPFSVRSA